MYVFYSKQHSTVCLYVYLFLPVITIYMYVIVGCSEMLNDCL